MQIENKNKNKSNQLCNNPMKFTGTSVRSNICKSFSKNRTEVEMNIMLGRMS